jgi:hypothetical protein
MAKENLHYLGRLTLAAAAEGTKTPLVGGEQIAGLAGHVVTDVILVPRTAFSVSGTSPTLAIQTSEDVAITTAAALQTSNNAKDRSVYKPLNIKLTSADVAAAFEGVVGGSGVSYTVTMDAYARTIIDRTA